MSWSALVLLVTSSALAAPQPDWRGPGWVSLEGPGGVAVVRRASEAHRQPGFERACEGAGRAVWASEGLDADWVGALCADPSLQDLELPPGREGRAGEQTPSWGASLARGGIPAPDVRRPEGVSVYGRLWPFRPLQLVVLGLWLTLGSLLPRRREPWLVGAVAFGVRAIADTPSVFMGSHYPYSRFTEATGLVSTNPVYGDAWSSFLGPLWWLIGGNPHVVTYTNLALSSLTPVLLTGWLLAHVERGQALAAGLLLAVAPVAVALSGTESTFVLVAFLQVCAVIGLSSADRRPRVAGALAAVLLANLRPVQWLFAVGCLLLVARRRAWAELAVLGLMLAARGLTIALAFSGSAGANEGSQVLQVLDPSYVLGIEGSLVISDPLRTPVVWLPMAAWVLWRRPQQVRFVLAAALAASTLPYLPFQRMTDAVRMEVPAMTWLAALAGLAWPGAGARPRLALAAACAASVVLAARPLGPRMTWMLEHDALLQQVPQLARGEVVRFAEPDSDPVRFELWINSWSPAVWVPLSRRPLADGELLWLGRVPRAELGCAVEARDVTVVPGRGGDIESLAGEPIILGLAELSACR